MDNQRQEYQHQLTIQTDSEGGSKRWIRSILQNPYPENPATFSRLVEALWSKTQFGYVQSHIDQQIDQGWTHYITKFKTASDGIDWENYHWN